MSYATSYLMAILMFVLSVTILEIFTVKMCMTLTLTFKVGYGQIYANHKPICDIIFDCNNNVYPVCHGATI